MNDTSRGLVGAYRRRTLCMQIGMGLAAGLAVPVATTLAQAPAAPAAQAKAPAKQADKKKDKKPPSSTRNPGTTRGQAIPPGANMRVIPFQGPVGNPPAGFPPGGAPPMPGVAAPGKPPATVKFDFTNADIMQVLKFYQMMTGVTLTVDPGVTGQVTIVTPNPITPDDAFKVLQSALEVRGFNAVKDGTIMKILPLDRVVKGGGTLVSPGVDENGKPKTDPGSQVITQVIPLENVDAEAMARELDPLKSQGASLIGSPGTNALIVTDTASNIQRFIDLVDALDKTSNNTELRIFPLKRAEATSVADIINNIYGKITTRGRGGAPMPGQPPPQPGIPQQSSGRPAVVAVADNRTNSVLVVASPDNIRQIAEKIINRLDEDDENTLDTKIRKIKFADATAVANLVNSVLTNMRPGAQSGGQQNQPRFGGFDPFGGFGQQQQQTAGSSSDPFGKVAADSRTNTVLITASPERMRKIDELIDQLDVDVPTESTTFVFPLKNAQAQDVAQALAQAFSTNQQNNNPFGGFFFGGFGNQNQQQGRRRQRIDRRFGSQGNSNNPFGRSVPPGPPNAPDYGQGGGYDGTSGGSAIPQGVQGVMTPDGFVPTQTDAKDPGTNGRTRQFFDFFGRRRGGIGQGGGPQFGRGVNGNFSNLLQLQSNVFVTPSPGGDSLIVTTTPDNYKAIKEIIEQLDVVQRQVMIEVIVAEVTLDRDEKLGLNIGGKLARLFSGNNNSNARVNLPAAGFGNTFDATATGGQFTVTGVNYDALLQALSTDDKIKVLSTPRIFTSNNQEADIEIVTTIPYISGQSSSGFGNSLVSNTVQTQDVGFILNVIPVITREGLVTIDLEANASDLVRFDTLGTGVSAIRVPVTNVRYANTLVTLQDGETVAVGGLIRDSEGNNITKIPILSDIPLLGQFFRSREKTRNKVELMIFMTPHVVNSVQEARAMTMRTGQSIIQQIPKIKSQQPNLDEKFNDRPVKGGRGNKTDEKRQPDDSGTPRPRENR